MDHPHQRIGVAGLPHHRRTARGIDLALEVDLLGEEPLAPKADQLFYLTGRFKRRQIDELWKARPPHRRALAQVLLSEVVLEAIRKELWRQTGHRVDTAEIVLDDSPRRSFDQAALKDSSSLPTPVDPVTK